MDHTTSRRLAGLSALVALAVVVGYVLALGTDWGLASDARTLPTAPTVHSGGHEHTALQTAFASAADASLALVALAVIGLVLLRRRADLAGIALTSLLGANASAYVLKPLLGRADLLGGESARALEASFPSGHATAAMSLALVAVVLAPPRVRAWVAALAAGFSAWIGVGLVAAAFHYPSDVLAGYLLAGVWVGATTALALARRERQPVVRSGGPLPTPRSVGTPTALALAAGAALLVPAAELGTAFAAVAVGIGGFALLLAVGLAVALIRAGRAWSSPAL